MHVGMTTFRDMVHMIYSSKSYELIVEAARTELECGGSYASRRAAMAGNTQLQFTTYKGAGMISLV